MKAISYHSILSGAEPFFLPGNDTGILLVHGLTGTPKEMRPLGDYLAKKGYTVLGLRLPGHATNIMDLMHIQWQDWLQAVEDGYYQLQSTMRRTFIVGLSMGGILALSAAARLPVAGVAALSTPYTLPPDPRMPFAKYLRVFMPQVAKQPADWNDQTAAQGHIEYPAYPTHSIVEVNELLSVMRASLPLIKAPVLLVHSLADGSIAYGNMQEIYNHLNAPKEMVELKHSGHMVTVDLEKEQVFQAIQQFIRKVSQTAV